MKTAPFILCALILGTLILAGCGEWRAKRKAEREAGEAKNTATMQKYSKQNTEAVSITNNTVDTTDWASMFKIIGDKENPVSTLIYLFDTLKSAKYIKYDTISFFERYNKLFKIPKHIQLVPNAKSRCQSSKKEFQQVYQMYVNGVEYLSSRLIVYLSPLGTVKSVSYNKEDGCDFSKLNTKPTLSERQSYDIVLKNIPDGHPWDPKWKLHFNRTLHLPDSFTSAPPSGELVIENCKLLYKHTFYTHNGNFQSWVIRVDAHTGAVQVWEDPFAP